MGISQVVVIGDRRPYLVALVTLDPAVVDEHGGPGDGNLNGNVRLRTLVMASFEHVNAGLGRWEQVKTFAILSMDFTVADDELTPTLKVKRRLIQKRYAEIIDGLYGSEEVKG